MTGPFTAYKAPEVEQDKQTHFFVKPAHIDKLYSPRASFIFGERGSGKTTILRYLEKSFNENQDHRWLAAYFRFETANMKSFYNQKMTEDENTENFSQILHAILCKILCNKLVEMKKNHNFKNEKDICRTICDLIDENYGENIDSFESLEKAFEKIRLHTLFGIRNKKTEMLFDYNNIFETVVRCIRLEDGFEQTSICILLDEYENLTVLQQRVINSMVKASSEMVIYKICLRPQGFWTRNTLSEREHLMEKDDYIKIDYTKDILGEDTEIQSMLRDVCRNRLIVYFNEKNIKYLEKDLNIDNYLEQQTIEKELSVIDNLNEYRAKLTNNILIKIGYENSDILKKFTDIIDLQLLSILLEKGYSFKEIYFEFFNKSNKYNNWNHNYKVNALYIILDECGNRKKFGGFDIILKLANYTARMILSILNYAFEEYDFSNGCNKMIGVDKQNKAILKVAKLKFNQIEYIPVHGYEVKNFINALGNLFKKLILDKRAKKFEVNNFTISASGDIAVEYSKHISDILKDAVIWGILLETNSNKMKNPLDYTYDSKDYILHPIYAVYFNISYRTKQKCYLKDDIIIKMFRPITNTQIASTAKAIESQYDLIIYDDKNKKIPGQIAMHLDKTNGVNYDGTI